MPAQKKDNRAFLFRCLVRSGKHYPSYSSTLRDVANQQILIETFLQQKIPADLGTLFYYISFTVSFGNLDTLHSCILIYFSCKIFRDYVSIQYILPYLLPRPSSTRTQTNIETCALEAATLQRSWDSLSHHAESGILWILASQPKPVCLVARSHTAISEHALDRSHLAATDAPVSDTSSSAFAAHTTSHVTSNHYHFHSTTTPATTTSITLPPT